MHPRSTDWLKVQEPNCSGGEARKEEKWGK
jgi:hypothetical protein